MAQDYWEADEVKTIVNDFMKYHADLMGAKIGCVFKEKASKSDGVPIVGKITKVPGKYVALMDEDYDFIIEVGADAWADLSSDKREAWIDHLLEHAYGLENDKTGEMSWKLRKPELMAFPCIINRHGLGWKTGLAKLATLNLPDPVAGTGPVRPASKGPKNTEEESETPTNTTPKSTTGDSFDDLMSDL